jgi:hypothetical protein
MPLYVSVRRFCRQSRHDGNRNIKPNLQLAPLFGGLGFRASSRLGLVSRLPLCLDCRRVLIAVVSFTVKPWLRTKVRAVLINDPVPPFVTY